MFIIQAVLTSHTFFKCWDLVASTTREYGFFLWMFPSGRPLTSAELMFGAVNQTELWENPELLDLDCLFDLRDCGLLYSVLSGNQIIVGALTVADLTQHVFAVSGSLILLAMR